MQPTGDARDTPFSYSGMWRGDLEVVWGFSGDKAAEYTVNIDLRSVLGKSKLKYDRSCFVCPNM